MHDFKGSNDLDEVYKVWLILIRIVTIYKLQILSIFISFTEHLILIRRGIGIRATEHVKQTSNVYTISFLFQPVA